MNENQNDDFDYAAVERACDGEESQDTTFVRALDAMEKLLRWQASRAIVSKKHVCPRTIGLRTIACLWVIRPDMFDGCSITSLSKRVGLGVTDTILSRYATEFRDLYGFKARGQRSEQTRARMRAAVRPNKK